MRLFAILVALCVINALLWVYFPGENIRDVDSVIGAAAIFGISAAEYWMLRLVVLLNRWTVEADRRAKLYRALSERPH